MAIPTPRWMPLLAVVVAAAVCAPGAAWAESLPRFTEEREAAALFFVKKQAPDLLPLLNKLKKDDPKQYQLEIREVFHVTEMLAELMDEPRRYELELKIWKTESKAHALVAKLSTPNEDERKRIEASLQEMARELVELDIQVLEVKADQLDKELGEAKDELAKAREQIDKDTKARYESLLEQAKKRRK